MKTFQYSADLYEFRNSIETIDGHSATAKGYISRKVAGMAYPYRGRFGIGWIIATPRYDSTQYHNIDYLITNLRYRISQGDEIIAETNNKRESIQIANRTWRETRDAVVVTDLATDRIIHRK